MTINYFVCSSIGHEEVTSISGSGGVGEGTEHTHETQKTLPGRPPSGGHKEETRGKPHSYPGPLFCPMEKKRPGYEAKGKVASNPASFILFGGMLPKKKGKKEAKGKVDHPWMKGGKDGHFWDLILRILMKKR